MLCLFVHIRVIRVVPGARAWAAGCLTSCSVSPYCRSNLQKDFIKCFLLGSDVLGSAAEMENSTFVFHIFSTKYANDEVSVLIRDPVN